MGSSQRIYRGSVRALSALFIGLGVAILVRTLSHGGAGLTLGVLLGVAFVAVGVARLWIAART